MSYVVSVYYYGPKTAFGLPRVHDSEIIYRQAVPRLWLARMLARIAVGNTGRCGFVITQGDTKVVEHLPTDPAYSL